MIGEPRLRAGYHAGTTGGLAAKEKKMKATLLGSLVLLSAYAIPAHAESEVDLWRQGYSAVWESGAESIPDGCDYDKVIKLSGGYYFECSGYQYVYHYGEVRLMSKSFSYQGRTIESTYLCMEGEDECLEGRLIRLR